MNIEVPVKSCTTMRVTTFLSHTSDNIRNTGLPPASEFDEAVALIQTYRTALEQIKLYHENMHGARAKDFIAYDIACKALEECNDLKF